jgi:hypothetical protein
MVLAVTFSAAAERVRASAGAKVLAGIAPTIKAAAADKTKRETFEDMMAVKTFRGFECCSAKSSALLTKPLLIGFKRLSRA